MVVGLDTSVAHMLGEKNPNAAEDIYETQTPGIKHNHYNTIYNIYDELKEPNPGLWAAKSS